MPKVFGDKDNKMASPIKETRMDDVVTVELSGYIGENSPLFEVSLHRVSRLIIDMAKVNYINSVGIKNWILWSRNIPDECRLELHNVPPSVVTQINQVAGFLPKKAVLHSIQVPYFCDTCSKEDTRIYKLGLDYHLGSGTEAGTVTHPKDVKCGKVECTYTTDVLESKFFKFLEFLKNS